MIATAVGQNYQVFGSQLVQHIHFALGCNAATLIPSHNLLLCSKPGKCDILLLSSSEGFRVQTLNPSLR